MDFTKYALFTVCLLAGLHGDRFAWGEGGSDHTCGSAGGQPFVLRTINRSVLDPSCDIQIGANRDTPLAETKVMIDGAYSIEEDTLSLELLGRDESTEDDPMPPLCLEFRAKDRLDPTTTWTARATLGFEEAWTLRVAGMTQGGSCTVELLDEAGGALAWVHSGDEDPSESPPVMRMPAAQIGGTQVRFMHPLESMLGTEAFRFQHGHVVVGVAFMKVECEE